MAKKCSYCGKSFTPNRRWQRFDTSQCRTNFHTERLKIASTPDFALFLEWRRLVGPVTRKEIELFARWRSRSRFLNHSPLNRQPVKKAESAKAKKNGKYYESKPLENRSENGRGDHGRLRTKRSHVRVVPGASIKSTV
jgi:hypothetical protein